jgi:hypothetical protein
LPPSVKLRLRVAGREPTVVVKCDVMVMARSLFGK